MEQSSLITWWQILQDFPVLCFSCLHKVVQSNGRYAANPGYSNKFIVQGQSVQLKQQYFIILQKGSWCRQTMWCAGYWWPCTDNSYRNFSSSPMYALRGLLSSIFPNVFFLQNCLVALFYHLSMLATSVQCDMTYVISELTANILCILSCT